MLSTMTVRHAARAFAIGMAVLVLAGVAMPALAADAPPPPIDWSDLIDTVTDPDLEVGEEMC